MSRVVVFRGALDRAQRALAVLRDHRLDAEMLGWREDRAGEGQTVRLEVPGEEAQDAIAVLDAWSRRVAARDAALERLFAPRMVISLLPPVSAAVVILLVRGRLGLGGLLGVAVIWLLVGIPWGMASGDRPGQRSETER